MDAKGKHKKKLMGADPAVQILKAEEIVYKVSESLFKCVIRASHPLKVRNMADSIGPTSGVPPLKEDRPRQRQRQSRSPYRASYDTEREEDPDAQAKAQGNGPDDEAVQMRWQMLPTSDALSSDHWKAPSEATEARKVVPTAYKVGRAVGEARVKAPASDPSVDASVMGVSAHLMSQNVQSAVTGLMRQMDDLRDRLVGAEQREAFLLAQTERDETLGVLNKRTFLQNLDAGLEQAKEEETAVFGALLYLENYDFLRRNQGLEAATSALVRLAAEFPLTDDPRAFSGTLGGTSLAVIVRTLPGEDTREGYDLFSRDVQARLDALHVQNPDLDVSVALLRAAPEREDASAFCRRLDAAMREKAASRSLTPDTPSMGHGALPLKTGRSQQ